MKNHNSSSFFGESDDNEDDDKATAPKTSSPPPRLNILFNQPSKEPPAERPPILSLFEAEKDKKEDDSEEDEDNDTDNDSDAATPAPILLKPTTTRSIGSILGRKPPVTESAPIDTSETDDTLVLPVDLESEPPELNTQEYEPAELINDMSAEQQDDEEPITPTSSSTGSSASGRTAASPPPPPNTPPAGGSGGGSGGGQPPRRPSGPTGPIGPTPPFSNRNGLPAQQPNPNQLATTPNTIIERTDSSGALLAFMGALYLNRRRKKDIKSIRREIKDTNKTVEQNQKRAESLEATNKAARKANESRTTALEQNRSTQDRVNDQLKRDTNRALKTNTAPEPRPLQPVVERAPQATIATKNEQIINQTIESPILPAVELAAAPLAAAAASEIAQLGGSELPALQPVTQRYEQQQAQAEREYKKAAPAVAERVQPVTESQARTTNETVLSKRREAQDNKAAAVFSGASTAPAYQQSRPSSSAPQIPAATPAAAAATMATATPQKPISQAEYNNTIKQSMQAGVGVGILAIVIGALAYFLMG